MPYNYSPYYQRTYNPYVPTADHGYQTDMLWVLNEAEATAYPVAPNASVVLWDKSNPIIYVKSVNAQGVPSMRVIEYKDRSVEPPKHECACGDKFASKEDFEALKAEVEKLRGKVGRSKKVEGDE